jgi:putative phosphoribosyl transferase
MIRRQTPSFENRSDAGQQLGAELAERGIDADIVLAIPRGGLPLGRAVADALEAPLDIVVAKKMGAPTNEELAIGAVASDGSAWLNDDLVQSQGIRQEYIERSRERQRAAAEEKAETYREDDGGLPDLAGKTVVIVDDGVATGATARACIAQVREAEPERIVLAVPVGSPRTIAELEQAVDEMVCLETPEKFRAVGQFYARFDQVSDEEAMTYLESE